MMRHRMEQTRHLLVIGSVALDTVTTPKGHSNEILGGSASYFSISASFFTYVNLVATVGRDFPDSHRKTIESFGVDVRGLEVKNGKTFRWTGSYGDDLNCARTIETQLNVFSEFRPDIPPEYEKSGYVFLANIDPGLQLHIFNKLKSGKFVGCDSMNYWIEHKNPELKKLLKKVSIVFLNDMEAKMLSGETNILKAGKCLISLGPKFAIIKRGEFGSVLFSKDFIFIAPAYLLDNIRDPTGAGDTFAGGFMGFLASQNKINRKNIKCALLYGTTMASFSVQDFSINTFLSLQKKDIEKRFTSFKKIIT